ncbi:MAG: thioredoxin-disulfide reductase [Deltaproteobacteria bacterium RIFCSPLOWO2_12_FULL_40_28]|nr:MAG: thioredoxin-disulfide reductase [Deltaproteobacteria bacterium RIFCSPHIGHO2_02_FULL_40_28]OGQ21075.1 MAG: thioredoxin-disulfide reductase [Deltaproteobacteria bacterium RIFCSPHIGHO2_12_FULL_40_32]OGQ38987.1 MAG: thioredoxin-disulfide reductase [Deltaproteobacteria bacterium RIFCSPLOWO2_02_FULL_40_36]OGQ53041.1 MAG: thioredoxin-disulfide reductase [Deltaproteobacteria bacterium RIFCSPLOWO2_12_FULL_40_28]
MIHNVIIIGSGPAGLTAAIYAARANLKPVLIEGYQSGGQLMITTDVENYPGFPKGVMGPELMGLWRAQAARFGTEIISKDVTHVDFSKSPFEVFVGKDVWQAKTVIIATGAQAKLLNLPNEMRLMGRGVSACATCDGAFFRGEKLALVGGGDTAMEEANFLTRFATEVAVIHRRDTLKASKIMRDRALKNPKIKFVWDSVVEDVLGENQVIGVKIKNLKTGQSSTLDCGGLFVAIGHQPNTQLFKDKLEMKNDYIITKDKSSLTNVPGIFACGDVQDHYYRQAVTAAGSGCMAAIDAERYLESLGH